MAIFFSRPSIAAIDQFMQQQSNMPLNYAATGATSNKTPPAGFVIDHNRLFLGRGEACFQIASAAVREFKHLKLSWVEPYPNNPTASKGLEVGVLAHWLGVWFLSACRIVYTIDELGPLCRSGFAYGTLPDHPETGEERFQIEWRRSDDTVWYDILAFSRANHWYSRLGYPMVRKLQKRFARQSLNKVQELVNDSRD